MSKAADSPRCLASGEPHIEQGKDHAFESIPSSPIGSVADTFCNAVEFGIVLQTRCSIGTACCHAAR